MCQVPLCFPAHDIDLPPRAVLGHIQRVKAIYPADMRLVTAQKEIACATVAHTTQSLFHKDGEQVSQSTESANTTLTVKK